MNGFPGMSGFRVRDGSLTARQLAGWQSLTRSIRRGLRRMLDASRSRPSRVDGMKPGGLWPRLARSASGLVLSLAFMPWPALGQANYAAPYTFTTIAQLVGSDFQSVAVDSAGNVYASYYADINWGVNIPEFSRVGKDWVWSATQSIPNGLWGFAVRTLTDLDPVGVAVDSTRNVYVADGPNNSILKVTPAGVVTTLAGPWSESLLNVYPGGYADGTGSAARFFNPSGVAVDSAGNVYVADSWNNAIRKATPAGVVTTLAGSPPDSDGYFGPWCGGFADGTGSAAQFCCPMGVAVDSAGNVYVADTYNSAIRKVTPAGVVTTLAGSPCPYGEFCGSADGTGSAAQFAGPEGVAVDTAGNV